MYDFENGVNVGLFLGIIIGMLLLVGVSHKFESNCQHKHNVADCKITYVPAEVEETPETLLDDMGKKPVSLHSTGT
jgi:hypothetical protein